MRTATRPWNPATAEHTYTRPAQWRDLAACAGLDTDMFYPDGRGLALRRAEQSAKAICDDCPVRTQCLDEAARRPERYGIWGGLTETDRGWSKR